MSNQPLTKGNSKKSAAERQKLFRLRHPDVVARQSLEQKLTREWVSELKNNPCSDCGGRFHVAAMDWDHVRGVKTMNVADMRKRNVALSKILDEIAKCDLVCANCHRVRTYMRSITTTKSAETQT